MSAIPVPASLLLCAGVATGAVLAASGASAQSVEGTATYRERMALPPGAVFEAVLEDVSRADVPATAIGQTRLESPGNPPFAFTIEYDPSAIDPAHRYSVRARILLGDRELFTSDTATPVITGGNPTKVSLLLRRNSGGSPATVDEMPPLENTYWRAIRLAGKPAPPRPAASEPNLTFHPDGRVSGSDGCNRISGSYERKGDAIHFGQMIGTQRACPGTAEIDKAFRDALTSAASLRLSGGSLELFDAGGTEVAAFTSRAPDTASLEGTSWRLVKFEGSDDTTAEPDDRDSFTLAFNADGTLTARIDCNRGRSTWTSSGPNQVHFGPLMITRAQCPDTSMHDRIVKHWEFIRSYVIRDGHLFLALMADGGIYEFEPIAAPDRP